MDKNNATYFEGYDKGYKNGLKDAWKIASKLVLLSSNGGYTVEDIDHIFGKNSQVVQIFALPIEEVVERISKYRNKSEYCEDCKYEEQSINNYPCFLCNVGKENRWESK